MYVLQSCFTTGIKCPPPPPLPPNYVCRQVLLEEMVSKLCQSSVDPNSYGTSLTVIGAGGFGKTSITTALCHHVVIKEQFMDGFVFIELGPQATDPSTKLSQLYHLLSGQHLKQGDINQAEQEIYHLTHLYCRNLLVIIDDVWHVKDAEPIVKAFSHCQIVLTTRMNDIEKYIPTKQVVTIGPMEQSEAISLLTSGVVDVGELSQVDMSLLDELAQDVYFWPLLLSLIRGQLANHLRQHKLSNHKAIHMVHTKLHDKGLMSFDKINTERSQKYAVKVCIEVSLGLLTKSLSDNLKSLVFYTGLGSSLQIAVLKILWKTTEHEARDIVDTLWAYGLIKFTDIMLPLHNKIQHCVEVHIVISQYIIEYMESHEILDLSFGELDSSDSAVINHFHSFCGVDDPASLPALEFLKFNTIVIEYLLLPLCLRMINSHAITDPHHTILNLQVIQDAIKISPEVIAFLPSISEQIDSRISDCHNSLKNAHKLMRTLYQIVQHCLTQRNYHKLIQTVENYMGSNCIASVVQQAITIVERIIPYCSGEIERFCVIRMHKILQTKTPVCHPITTIVLPLIKSCTRKLQLVYASLLTGSPDPETMHNYLLSVKEELLYKDPPQEMFPNGM